MDRLLARLERYFGKLAIAHLSHVIVGGMAVVFVLGLQKPAFLELLTLDTAMVARGQVWRLFTYLFLPGDQHPLLILLSLYWIWLIGNYLETEWGSFKFNVYYLFGMIGTTFAALITGMPQTNSWINTTMGLAFGTVFPEFEFFLLFIPMKAKWMAWITAAFLVFRFVVGDNGARAAIAAGIANYLLFFGPLLVGLWRERNRRVHRAAQKWTSDSTPSNASGDKKASVPPARVCAICGATEEDGADIRVCSCATCGGPRMLCLPHARAH